MRTAGKTDKNQRMESEGLGKPREKFKREKMINGHTALGWGWGVNALSVN